MLISSEQQRPSMRCTGPLHLLRSTYITGPLIVHRALSGHVHVAQLPLMRTVLCAFSVVFAPAFVAFPRKLRSTSRCGAACRHQPPLAACRRRPAAVTTAAATATPRPRLLSRQVAARPQNASVSPPCATASHKTAMSVTSCLRSAAPALTPGNSPQTLAASAPNHGARFPGAPARHSDVIVGRYGNLSAASEGEAADG